MQRNLKRYRASVLQSAVEGRLVPNEADIAAADERDYETADELLERVLVERKAKWIDDYARGLADRAKNRNEKQGKPFSDAQWQAYYEKKLKAGATKYEEPESPDTSELPELPEGWRWVMLDSLLSEPLRNGKSGKKSQNQSGIRTLTLSAVTQSSFIASNTKLTVTTETEAEGLWLQSGDILVERSNTPELVGTAALFCGPNDWAIFPDLMIRVRISFDINSRFVASVLGAKRTRDYFRSNAKGISGSMPKIDQATVAETPIPLPPLAEQRRIVAEVERHTSVIDKQEEAVSVGLTRLSRLRQSILKWAFEGKLVDQDPNDEPASELLKRLKAKNGDSAADQAELTL